MAKPDALKAARTSISAPRILLDGAQAQVERGGFSNFSDYVQALLRADSRRGIVSPKNPLWKKMQSQLMTA